MHEKHIDAALVERVVGAVVGAADRAPLARREDVALKRREERALLAAARRRVVADTDADVVVVVVGGGGKQQLERRGSRAPRAAPRTAWPSRSRSPTATSSARRRCAV